MDSAAVLSTIVYYHLGGTSNTYSTNRLGQCTDSDRHPRPAYWTPFRLTAISLCDHRWKRHRRCHGTRSRAVCSCCSLIQRSCCRTQPTATHRLILSSLPHVNDNLKRTSLHTNTQRTHTPSQTSLSTWVKILHSQSNLKVLIHDRNTCPILATVYKMPRYRREDRAMRPGPYSIWVQWKKFASPWLCPQATANFPDILMNLFRSIRKKSCGSASADNRVRSPHTICAAPATTLGAGPPTAPSYWKLEQGLFIATAFL